MLLDGIFYDTVFKHIPIEDEAVWNATLAQWKAEALSVGEEGVFLAADYERQLVGRKQLVESEKNIHCYFLVKDGSLFASSLLEISYAMPESENAWLKLLNITLQPSLFLALERKTLDGISEAYPVIAHSIIHVLTLTFKEHPSKVLKIFGRTEEIRGLFVLIVSGGILNSALEMLGLSVKLEGNWLVLTKIS